MYLIAQLWWYLLLAFLLGLAVGYLLWRFCGRRAIEARYSTAAKAMPTAASNTLASTSTTTGSVTSRERELQAALEKAQHDLELARTHAKAELQSLLADDAKALASEVAKAKAQAEATARQMHAQEIAALKEQIAQLQAQAPVKTTILPQTVPLAFSGSDKSTSDKASLDRGMPSLLTAPRNGTADDLKLIWGVGPKLETQLNTLGIYHFDQIAALTPQQLSWVERKLTAFNVDPDRDKWIDQARKLATGWRPTHAAGDKPH